MMWHVNFMRNKDAQKQLACMSLSSNQVHQFECSRESLVFKLVIPWVPPGVLVLGAHVQ